MHTRYAWIDVYERMKKLMIEWVYLNENDKEKEWMIIFFRYGNTIHKNEVNTR